MNILLVWYSAGEVLTLAKELLSCVEVIVVIWVHQQTDYSSRSVETCPSRIVNIEQENNNATRRKITTYYFF